MRSLLELVPSPFVPFTRKDRSDGVIDLRSTDVWWTYIRIESEIAALIRGRNVWVSARWCQPRGYGPFSLPPGAMPIEITRGEALRQCLHMGATPPDDLVASLSDPGEGTSNPSPSPGEDAQRAARPPGKKRRGRTAGVNKIDLALTEVSARLKDCLPTTVLDIAKAVGCDVENLKRSKRFMRDYKELTDAMTRLPNHKGSKTDGNLEAWPDPGEDRDEDEDSDF